MTTKRPLSSRFWFYKPDWCWDWRWIKAWGWKVTYTGGDEYDWHTRVFGFPFTGQIVVATRHCSGSKKCCLDEDELPLTDWPVTKNSEAYEEARLQWLAENTWFDSSMEED